MRFANRVTGLLVTAALALPLMVRADTQSTHRTHKAKKEQPPPPLPSGTRGPVPQVPLDAIPPIAPQVTYSNGMLTIVAPNSTLGDILRGVRKHTSADIEIPPTASERVVTHLGPAPAREVMAELLNGSRFNYILMGSTENANDLTRVVLVARTTNANGTEILNAAAPADPNNPGQPVAANAGQVAENPEADAPEENAEDTTEQNNAEAETPQPENQVKTPQQMLQEMQQRQMMMQQQTPGQPMAPGLMPPPRQPQPPDQQQ